MNGAANSDLLNNLLSTLNANPDSQQPIVVEENDELLDIIDMITDQMILDQPIVTPETDQVDPMVSNDEIEEMVENVVPVYLVLL